MSNVRLSKSLCAVVGSVLSGTGSHTTLDALFESAGAPGDPPDLAHHSKWKEWLFQAGQDSSVDSLAVLGNVLEEFMDMALDEWDDDSENWHAQRGKIETTLEQNGLRYFRFGRVLPQGQMPSSSEDSPPEEPGVRPPPAMPTNIEAVLQVLSTRSPASHASADPPTKGHSSARIFE